MAPTVSVPASGFSSPTIIRNSVVLPGAVGPDDADDATRRQEERQVVDEQAVAEPLDDACRRRPPGRPDRGPGGMVSLDPVRPPFGGLGLGHEVVVGGDARLALALACPGRHADPLELALERGSDGRGRPSPPRRGAPASARATTSSCPPRGCPRRGRARGSSRPRCRGSSGRGSPRRRCPGTPAACRSSQATDSASRWFVGSSSRSRSGLESSSRHSATRRRSPPESVPTRRHRPAGSRSASMAISNVRSRSQAPAASILSCSSACSASSASMSASGSPNAAQTSLNAVDQRLRLADALRPRCRPRLSTGSSWGSWGR